MTNPTPPEGWVMAPREPTEAMVTAAQYTKQNHWQSALRSAYRAMLSAAPTPPPAGQSLESDPGTASTQRIAAEILEYLLRVEIRLGDDNDLLAAMGLAQTLSELPQYGSTVSLSDRLLRLAEGWEKEADNITDVNLFNPREALRHAAQQVREALKES